MGRILNWFRHRGEGLEGCERVWNSRLHIHRNGGRREVPQFGAFAGGKPGFEATRPLAGDLPDLQGRLGSSGGELALPLGARRALIPMGRACQTGWTGAIARRRTAGPLGCARRSRLRGSPTCPGPLAAGLTPPRGLASERPPGGGLILSAARERLDPFNSEHLHRAGLLEAIMNDRIGRIAPHLSQAAELPARDRALLSSPWRARRRSRRGWRRIQSVPCCVNAPRRSSAQGSKLNASNEKCRRPSSTLFRLTVCS